MNNKRYICKMINICIYKFVKSFIIRGKQIFAKSFNFKRLYFTLLNMLNPCLLLEESRINIRVINSGQTFNLV